MSYVRLEANFQKNRMQLLFSGNPRQWKPRCVRLLLRRLQDVLKVLRGI